MAVENNLNEEEPKSNANLGFDLGQYIQSKYVAPPSEESTQSVPRPAPRIDINAELGYNPAEELSKYMAENFKTSIDAGMMDLQDLEEINKNMNKDPYSIDATRTMLQNQSTYNLPDDPFGTFKSMMGDFRDPNEQNTFYKRYYEHPKFDQLGFSPFRNNEEYYNSNSSGWDDFRRAGGEMLTLAGIGLAENFGLSDLEDITTSKRYAEAAAIGTSSRKGLGAFATNTFLNSGYTVGLILGFAAEEALLIGAEALGATLSPATGGTSLGLTGAAATRQAFSIGKFGKNLAKAYEAAMRTRKLVDKVQDASKARKFFNATMNFLNPLENTTDFFKTINQLDDLSKLTKTVRGVGAFIKDTRGVRAAWNEAALEANMVQDEMQRNLLAEFKARNNGRSPNKEEAAKMAATIKQATSSTALHNAVLILGTNKLTLGPLLRPMNRALGGGIYSLGKGAGNFIYTASKKGVPEAYKLLSKNYAKRSLQLLRHPKALLQRQLLYSTDNVMEGIQEVSQEAIADWQKEYHTAMFEGNEARGAYYDFLGRSIEKQMSPEGFEVFMSGFLMQKFVSPLTIAGGKVFDKQNYSDLRLFATDREAYYKAKKDRQKQDEDTVAKLNDFYKNNTEYLAGDLMNLVRQGEYAAMLKNAESIGDAKSWHDIKDSSRFDHFMNLIRHNRLDGHLDLLKGLKDLTADEVMEEYKMDLNTFHDVIDKSVERAESIQNTYKGLQAKMPNPVNYKQYKYGSPEYMDAFRSHKAWNDVIESIAFNKFAFQRSLERAESIVGNAQNNLGLKNVAFSEFSAMFGKTSLKKELDTLSLEISTLEKSAILTDDIKEQLKDKKERMKLLKEFNSNVDNVLSRSANEKFDDPVQYESLLKAYTDYVTYLAKKSGDPIDSSEIESSLTEVIDYYKLKGRTEGMVEIVNFMIDPEGFNQLFKRQVDIYQNAESSMKEEIKKSYDAYKKGNKLHNDLLNALADMGVFVRLEDLQALKDEGIFPEHFFYVSPEKSGIELAHNTKEYQDLVELFSEYYEIKEGIDTVPFKERYSIYDIKSRAKKKNDQRTYEDLATQFGFDASQETTEVPLKQVLQSIIDSKFADEREKALAQVLLKSATDTDVVVFSKTNTTPAEYNVGDDKVIVNATFSANEYKQGRSNAPLEAFILHGEIQRKLSEALDQDADFKSDLEDLLKDAKEAWSKLTAQEKAEYSESSALRGLDNINDFAVAAMTNLRFQKFLGTVKSTTQTNTTPLWKRFVDTILKRISSILKVKTVNGTVLNATLGIVTTKIDPAGFTPNTQAPKTNGTQTAVTRDESIASISANHPELYNALVDAFIEYNEGRIERGEDSVIPENTSRKDIAKLPFFKQFVSNRAFVKPEKIFKDYNAKLGVKPGAGTTTTTGSVPLTITKAVRQQLLDLGYSKTDIDKMKPEEAQEIIKNQTTKPKATDSKAGVENVLTDSQKENLEKAKKGEKAEPAKVKFNTIEELINHAQSLAGTVHNVNGLKVEFVDYKGEILTGAGQRVFVKVLINGVPVTFYSSTGSGKKALQEGIFYPTLGIESDERYNGTWINKIDGVEMASYYNSPALALVGAFIDSQFGNTNTYASEINQKTLDLQNPEKEVLTKEKALEIRKEYNGEFLNSGRKTFENNERSKVVQAFKDLVQEIENATANIKDDSGKRTMPKAPAEEIVYIAPKSGIATREVTSKLRELGFTAADISAMSDAQKYQYANDNLTKEESKEWYDFIKEQDEDFAAQRDIAETARQEINAVIESATTYEEWLDLPNKIYGQDMQNIFIQSNYTVANIKSLLEEKLKRLAFISNFKDVKVGEFIGVERVNKNGQKYVAIVTVSAKDKDSITLQYLAPNSKGEFSTFKINKEDLKDTKMYKSSKALDNVDIDEGPEIDPQGNDAAKQSVTNLNDINFDNAEIESTADSKTSEEVDNDFLNDIKNNCE